MSKTGRKTKSRNKKCIVDEIDHTTTKNVPETSVRPSDSNGTDDSSSRFLEQVLSELSISCNEIEEVPCAPESETPKFVLYYGWFFSQEVCVTLKDLSTFYLKTCLKVPQFERFLRTQCSILDERDVYEFYKTPRKKKASDPLKYHVTAKFLDRKEIPEYQIVAQQCVEKVFKIHLTGLFFTSKTHGFRVRTTDSQKHLFDEREGRENEFLQTSKTPPPSPEEIISAIEDELTRPLPKTKLPPCPSGIHKLLKNTSVSTLSTCSPSVLRSRAHVTIGCAPRVKAVQSGRDLLDIVDLESRVGSSSTIFHKDYPIDGGTLRQFGKDPAAFVIYPCHEIIAEATFRPFI